MRGGRIELAVERDDAAECRRRVGAVREVVRGQQVCRDGDAAGIRVLDDHAGRLVELAHALEGRVGIREVVVREILALQLRRRADAGTVRLLRQVERRLLMRILAVAQIHALAVMQREPLGEGGLRAADLAVEIRRHGRVVLRRVREGLGRETQRVSPR